METPKATEKQLFVENVKLWVQIDSQLKMINEKTKTLREKKTEALNKINTFVKDNEMQNTKIEITDGELRFYEKKEYSPLTYSYLQESLGKIISDPKQVEFIMNYLKDNRQVKTVEDIKRNYFGSKSRASSFS